MDLPNSSPSNTSRIASTQPMTKLYSHPENTRRKCRGLLTTGFRGKCRVFPVTR